MSPFCRVRYISEILVKKGKLVCKHNIKFQIGVECASYCPLCDEYVQDHNEYGICPKCSHPVTSEKKNKYHFSLKISVSDLKEAKILADILS